MSQTVSTIPIDQIVSVVPSVLGAGGAALDLCGLLLTQNAEAPYGQVLNFPNEASVGAYFGETSREYLNAEVYFSGFEGCTKLPANLLIAQFPNKAVSAYLRGGSLADMTLGQLQNANGAMTIQVDGTNYIAPALDLSASTSFTDAAQYIAAGLNLIGAERGTALSHAGATFTCDVATAGSTIVASGVSGTINIGDQLVDGTHFPPGTTVVAYGSGSGAAGTYVLSVPVQPMTAVPTIASSTTITFENVDFAPAIFPGDQVVNSEFFPSNRLFITAQLSGTGGQAGSYLVNQHVLIIPKIISTIYAPGVTFNSLSASFQFNSPTTGPGSTINYPLGTIVGTLNLTQKTGAVISPGTGVPAAATFFDMITGITRNWASTWVDYILPSATRLAIAEWINAQNKRFCFITRDNDITATEGVNPLSFGGQLLELGFDGTMPIYEPDGVFLHHDAFTAGFIASLDFGAHEGRATMAFKSQGGLVPGVTTALAASYLELNGYNYYGAFATGSQGYTFMYPGSVSGEFKWLDSYVNQIQLSNALQQALISLLTSVKSLPYNAQGYGLVRAAIMDPVAAAINFGTIRTGVPLSSAQAAEVNNTAGFAIDTVLSTAGFYLLILPATAQTRALRQSPPLTLFYMDGQSIQRINLASILVQ